MPWKVGNQIFSCNLNKKFGTDKFVLRLKSFPLLVDHKHGVNVQGECLQSSLGKPHGPGQAAYLAKAGSG